jgi:hypothetical protein
MTLAALMTIFSIFLKKQKFLVQKWLKLGLGVGGVGGGGKYENKTLISHKPHMYTLFKFIQFLRRRRSLFSHLFTLYFGIQKTG